MPGIHRTLIRLAILAALATVHAPATFAQTAFKVDVPSQELADALRAVGRQTSTNVIFEPAVVKGVRVAQLRADLTPDEAIRQLLDGTRLTAQRTSPDTIVVQREKKPKDAVPAKPTAQTIEELDRKSAVPPSPVAMPEKRGFFDRFRLAQTNDARATQGGSVANTDASAESNDRGALDEIVVTAQKRLERLQDVPVPVTAIDAATLAASNRVRVQDYFSSIPGLSAAPVAGLGTSQVAIRGVTTGGISNPTVGIVIDDVPYGSSSYWANGFAAPDIDPSDLSRLEVLRGPQGTLYGASSMGGLIKFVTVDPSTSQLTGNLQVGTTDIRDGGNWGYNARGAVNVPLSDTLAIRASAFTRQDPGYIDNVRTGEQDVNEGEAHGGRLSMLWRPSDLLSLKLSALIQDARLDGDSFVDLTAGIGDLEHSALRGTGWNKTQTEAYSATLTAKWGAVDVASMTGYNIATQHTSYDFSDSAFWSDAINGLYGVTGAPLLTDVRTSRFTQEIRLTAPLGDHFDGLLGVFYSDEDSSLVQAIPGANQTTGQVVGPFFAFSVPTTLKEYAAFADLTWQATDRFDIQFGARQGHYKQTVEQTYFGVPFVERIMGATAPLIVAAPDAKDDAFTYLVTPRLRISEDLMLYARFASGYRIGGANASPGATLPQFAPDQTENYELGIKGDALDKRLSFDASIYYIDWTDIQLQLRDPQNGIVYFTNASGARSQGIEISTELRPAGGLRISAWAAWNDAELSKDIPPDPQNAVGNSGDRLPNSSRFSGNLSVEQEFPLSGATVASISGSVSYVGERVGTFLTGSPNRQLYPSYAQTDLRMGLEHGTWRVNLFANNVTDRRGVLSGGTGSLVPTEFFYIQPRTIGLTLFKTFE